jgi:hypothetical protein
MSPTATISNPNAVQLPAGKLFARQEATDPSETRPRFWRRAQDSNTGSTFKHESVQRLTPEQVRAFDKPALEKAIDEHVRLVDAFNKHLGAQGAKMVEKEDTAAAATLDTNGFYLQTRPAAGVHPSLEHTVLLLVTESEEHFQHYRALATTY